MPTVDIDAVFIDDPDDPTGEEGTYHLRAEVVSRSGPRSGERFRARRLGLFAFDSNKLQDPNEWLECEVVKVEHHGGRRWTHHLRMLNRTAVAARQADKERQGELWE